MKAHIYIYIFFFLGRTIFYENISKLKKVNFFFIKNLHCFCTCFMDLTLSKKMRISPILENEVDDIINCDCFGLRESKGETNSMQKMKKK